MSLETDVMGAMKNAMKEKNKVALESLRAIKSQIILAKTSGQGTEISHEQELAILQRMVKQRKDSAQEYRTSGRDDLAEVEEAQMSVIAGFLPKQLSPEELETAIKAIIAQVGAKDLKDLGKVMGTASKSLAGKSDGRSISAMAKQLLS